MSTIHLLTLCLRISQVASKQSCASPGIHFAVSCRRIYIYIYIYILWAFRLQTFPCLNRITVFSRCIFYYISIQCNHLTVAVWILKQEIDSISLRYEFSKQSHNIKSKDYDEMSRICRLLFFYK